VKRVKVTTIMNTVEHEECSMESVTRGSFRKMCIVCCSMEYIVDDMRLASLYYLGD
jgi:hypothetical protein